MDFEDPALYPDARTRAIAFFRSLTAEQAATAVPLSPEWSVHDVVAHVCGINADVVQGRLEGLGSDEWTADQVEARRDRGVGEICDEWAGYAAKIDEAIAADPFFGVRLTGDLIIHVQDVQHALGLPIERDDVATRAAAHRYAAHLQTRVRDLMDVGIRLELTDGRTYEAPSAGAGSLTLRCSSYDFVRSVTGRRSRRQIEALGWSGDPSALLDRAWSAYGPIRSEDVSA